MTLKDVYIVVVFENSTYCILRSLDFYRDISGICRLLLFIFWLEKLVLFAFSDGFFMTLLNLSMSNLMLFLTAGGGD